MNDGRFIRPELMTVYDELGVEMLVARPVKATPARSGRSAVGERNVKSATSAARTSMRTRCEHRTSHKSP